MSSAVASAAAAAASVIACAHWHMVSAVESALPSFVASASVVALARHMASAAAALEAVASAA